jgi:hypothetical protein
MSASASALQVPVRSSGAFPWKLMALALALAVAITIAAIGLLGSSGSTNPGTGGNGPVRGPVQVVQPVKAVHPIMVGGVYCGQCR